ncbi:hypothetical protein SB783_34365 [Paraburkholderia sp. SIMBA_009]
MKFKRNLSFSPRLTFVTGQDGNFYPPLDRLTGISRRVRVEHAHVEVGEQTQLYSLAEQVFAGLDAIGAKTDEEVNQVVRAAIGHAANARHKALVLLERDGAIKGHEGLTRERIFEMWPDDLMRLAIKDEQFGIPKNYLSLCLLGIILHLIDAALCALQSKPSAAVESAMRAAHCFNANLSLVGMSILGKQHPSHKGGQAKRDRSERVAKYACSLVQGKTFASRADAVRRIKAQVMEYARTTEAWHMSELQADTTISSWLAARGLPC